MLRLALIAVKKAWRELRALPLRAAVALGSAGLEEAARPRRLWRVAAIILPISVAVWWIFSRVILVVSPSIDAWVVTRAPGLIGRGDLVSFSLNHPLAGPTPVNVTKYALCMPGDSIAMAERPSASPGQVDGWYFCNGQLLGVSKAYGRNGQHLDHWRPAAARIPPGMIYVGSRNPNGFDSRYYGPVALARLTRMEKLL